MRLSGGLGEDQPVRCAIEVENLGVAAPVHGGFELPLHFILAEVLVEDVVEKFLRNGVIRLGVQNAVDLLEDHDVFKSGLAEKNLAGEDVGFREANALGGDFDIAFLQCGKAEQHRSLDDREQVFGIHDEDFGETIQVFLSAAVLQQLQQTGDAPDARVRKHLIFLTSGLLHGCGRVGHSEREVGLRHDLVDVIDQFDKARRLAIAGMRQFNGEIGAHPRRIFSQHNHAVRQQHRFFDIVRDDENRAGRHLLTEPEFEQFVAQVFRREHVERRKRLIHEQDFGLHHQRARKADALFHAAGKLFRVGALEAIQSNGIENAQRAFVTLESGHSASFERGFDVVEHGQPGEQRKTLEDDGHAGVLRRDGLPMPQDFA